MAMKRRFVIAGITSCLGLSSGCVALSSSMPGGGLVIRNNDDTSHTFFFTVLKMSEENDDLPHSKYRDIHPDEQPPDQLGQINKQPLDEWEQTLDVGAGDSLQKKEFITEPGAYFVEVSLENSNTSGTWIGLYAAGRNRQELAESYLTVTAEEDGAVRLSPVTLD